MITPDSFVVSELLFVARVQPDGTIRDPDVLVGACPQVFQEGNRWVECAKRLEPKVDMDVCDWIWKDEDPQIRGTQLQVLLAIQWSDLKKEDRHAIAGWVLSEMLQEVPQVH